MPRDDRKTPEKPQPQQKQWAEMSPDEKRLWCLYFKGKGPRPVPAKVIKFAA